ncbi:hypothetical protein AO370_0605 [Moraxella catarrhalis]|uniref:Uncharacterized protein n=1 Tax=Moraxella catarrhalis TaxID=480 RepID=A0AB36DQ98_MORCA|nr:hypothetical protein AO370_0605 [Moraxella catarrhalis]
MLGLFCCQCFQPKYTLSYAIDKYLKSLVLSLIPTKKHGSKHPVSAYKFKPINFAPWMKFDFVMTPFMLH